MASTNLKYLFRLIPKTIDWVIAMSLLLMTAGIATAQTSLDDYTQDRISQHLKAAESKYGIVGHSVAILKNGNFSYSNARGLASLELNVQATEHTVYQVFSVAKLFVHVTIMQLAESGKIELDSSVGRYLPALPKSWSHVTIREALSHMSGLPDYYRWPNPTPKSAQEALTSVADSDLEFESGSATRYNQTNYLLLRMIIETVTGKDFLSAVTTRMITSPNLENTRYGGEFAVVPRRATMYRATPEGVKRNVFIDQPDYMFASSGLNSNVIDLAKWFSALLNRQFVSKQTLDSMWTPILLNDGTIANFANGWEYSNYDGITVVGHGGGNRADVRHYVSDRDGESVTIIYLTNGSEKDFWPGSVSAGLAKIIFSAASIVE